MLGKAKMLVITETDMDTHTLHRFLRALLASLLLLLSSPVFAGCFPVPAFWGFAIACTLDREGRGPELLCGAEKVDKQEHGSSGSYVISGKCTGGPDNHSYFFEGESNSDIFVPATPRNTQESVTIFTDAAHHSKLGKIQGVYTCQTNPFTDIGASCKADSHASTVQGNDILLTRQPLMRGLAASENVGSSSSALKTAEPRGYAGVFHTGNDPYYLWRAKGWSAFVDKWKELSSVGLRLADIETFKSGGDVWFIGVWREGHDAHYLWRAKGWKAFSDKWKELGAKKLRLTRIETYTSGKDRYYVGVWRSGSDGYYLWSGATWKDFTSKWSELNKDKLRLVDIETYAGGDGIHYIGVWRSGSDRYYLWNVDSWKALADKWKELGPKHYRLIDVDVLKQGNKTHYIGVWRSGTGGYALWHSRTWNGMVDKWKELGAEHLRLTGLAVD
ncbi:MAG: hypothetical protein WB783_04245 [Arenicellales bacterium]